MAALTLSFIPEILFGAGRIGELGAKAEVLAGKCVPVLMVADPALKALGITGRAVDVLTKAGSEIHAMTA